MTFWELIRLFAAFTVMWILLEAIAHRFARKPNDRARVESALEREKAAHDRYQRAVGRIGRLPE